MAARGATIRIARQRRPDSCRKAWAPEGRAKLILFGNELTANRDRLFDAYQYSVYVFGSIASSDCLIDCKN